MFGFEFVTLALIVCIIATVCLFRSRKNNLPPSPVGFPVIGHLHLLKEPVHRSLRDLSKTLGPLYSLRLGSRRAIVVTSASAADEFLTGENDIVFANRPYSTLGEYVAYNNTMVSAAPYSELWRKLRRVCAVEIFSTARLRDSMEIRRDEVRALIRNIHVVTSEGSLKVRPMFNGLTFNIIMRMVAGKSYYGKENDGDEESRQVRELISETFEFGGFTYVGDFLPVLNLFDFDGYIKRCKKLGSRLDNFLQKLVDEHRINRGTKEFEKTMITHLLSLQETEPEYYTDDIIKGLVLVMVLAGTHTAAVTLEWTMANLLNHPEVMKKLKTELNDVVSKEDRLLEESDVETCAYLNHVISETLRLYPAAPLLVPHLSTDNCTVVGYDIPRGTWLFINAWAIQRDPNVWDEPESFKPERFENETQRDRGTFIPFGMGRRACPGMGLAQSVLGLALGSLIQCFDWERDGDEEVDMSEGRGLTVPKAVPLEHPQRRVQPKKSGNLKPMWHFLFCLIAHLCWIRIQLGRWKTTSRYGHVSI